MSPASSGWYSVMVGACAHVRALFDTGSFATATCCACGFECDCEAIRAEIFAQRIPRCSRCVGDTAPNIIKPDIVFFGEALPSHFHEQITDDKDVVDLLIVMGSSMKVRPVALIPGACGVHMCLCVHTEDRFNSGARAADIHQQRAFESFKSGHRINWRSRPYY
jgi:NAD-dependent SIR2 family protein deacetylase